MKKILVTTDFSAHSKAGMRFAIQLAAQTGDELVFFHCFQAVIPTTIHRESMEKAVLEQTNADLKKLERFAASLLKSMHIKIKKYWCAVAEDLSPENAILQYAQKHAIHYICISTRGAGGLGKIIGTNTSNIIVKSPVPVLVIPHHYRLKPLKKIVYAADLENIEQELPLVTAFAESITSTFNLLHFYHRGEVPLEEKALYMRWKQNHPLLDKAYFEAFDMKAGFAKQLDRWIHKSKPQLVVFFTHTNLTWFDKLFSVSRTETFSFVTKVPMLVYRKPISNAVLQN